MKIFRKAINLVTKIFAKYQKYYTGEETVSNAKCCHCGKVHEWDDYTCEVYNWKFVCADCYQDYYGNCNGCGKLHRYEDMNEDIYCKECSK